MLFGIHHSCKPEHIDKNLAFMFPIWDWLFGTYHLPRQRPEMIMGLGDGTESEYNSFARIYALPFIRLFSSQDGNQSHAGVVGEPRSAENQSAAYPDQGRSKKGPGTTRA